MKKTLMGAICAMLFAVAATAATNAIPVVTNAPPSNWAVTLGGVGLTAGPNIFNDWQWGGELGFARKIDLGLELFQKPVRTDLGLRQTFAYGTTGYQTSTHTESIEAPCSDGPIDVTSTTTKKLEGWTYRTEVFWDFNVPIYKRLSFFAGPNFAVLYGTGINPSWTFGPEGGFKLDLGKNWNLFTRANYDWNLSQSWSGFRVSSGVGFEF